MEVSPLKRAIEPNAIKIIIYYNFIIIIIYIIPNKIEIFVFNYFYNKLQTVKLLSSSINYASAHTKLQNIAVIISKHECNVIAIMKSLIRELTIVINGLSNGEKIQFIEEFSKIFKLNHHMYPEAKQ